MGLLDWFKRKKLAVLPAYVAVNRLEEAFQEATHSPSARPAFYKLLLHHDILVAMWDSGEKKPDGGHTLQLMVKEFDGVPAIYAFTSEDALNCYLKAFNGGKSIHFVAMNSLTFLGFLDKRLGMFLNPGLAFGKLFVPAELEEIRTGVVKTLTEHTVPEGTAMQFGPPRVYPQELVDTLREYTRKTPELRNCYFGQMHEETNGGETSYLIVLDLVREFSDTRRDMLKQDIARMVRDFSLTQPVTFLFRGESGGLVEPAIVGKFLLPVLSEETVPS